MPVQTMEEYGKLNRKDLLKGYDDGINFKKDLNKNRAYATGYRFGINDAKGIIEKWQTKLVNTRRTKEEITSMLFETKSEIAAMKEKLNELRR